jgi:hypothetical protein
MRSPARAHDGGRNLSSLRSAAEVQETNMKMLATLTVAALLTAGSAFAASPTPTATPASNVTPASAVKHGAMHCEKEAKARKLSGKEQRTFVKECREGKTS